MTKVMTATEKELFGLKSPKDQAKENGHAEAIWSHDRRVSFMQSAVMCFWHFYLVFGWVGKAT